MDDIYHDIYITMKNKKGKIIRNIDGTPQKEHHRFAQEIITEDEINVELRCEAHGYPFSRRVGIININNLKEYSFNMSENLIVDMDISFKERYGNIKS